MKQRAARASACFDLVFTAHLFVLTAAFVWSHNALAQGQAFDYTNGVRGARLWIPPGLTSIKGILIYGNGAGGDSRDEIYTPWNQQFAELEGFAVIGTSMWGNLAGTEINTWDTSLAALAKASNHPELVNAPWAPIGFSNGGQMSYGFNAQRPEKTIAFITDKGGFYNNPLPSAAALKTPGILIAAELDTAQRRDAIHQLFTDNRPRGAQWSWVEQQGVAHERSSDSLQLLLMAEAIRRRYPADQSPTATTGVTLKDANLSDAWLTDQTTWKTGLTKIAAYNDYAGDKQTAGWLLDKNMAFVYRAFSTYNRAISLSFNSPRPPFTYDVWGGDVSEPLSLTLDLTNMPGGTKVQLFDYAQLLLESPPGVALPNLLTFNVPITHTGVYGFSVLVTSADGITVSTSNILAYMAVPEPNSLALMVLGFMGMSRKRGTPRRITCKQSESMQSCTSKPSFVGTRHDRLGAGKSSDSDV